jgi:hypothetical protein
MLAFILLKFEVAMLSRMICHTLIIHGSFKNVFSSSNYTAWDGRIIREQELQSVWKERRFIYGLHSGISQKMATFVIACGSVVVETIGYSPGGRGFETR